MIEILGIPDLVLAFGILEIFGGGWTHLPRDARGVLQHLFPESLEIIILNK